MTGLTETAAAGPLVVALGLCVLAGLVSFASPCVVPLVPGYLSYLAALVAGGVVHLLQLGDLRAARPAPLTPDVDHHHLAREVAQREGFRGVGQ